MLNSLISGLLLVAGIQAAAIPARQAKAEYLTVLTETDFHWTRQFPDNLNPIVNDIYGAKPINVSCWITTTMQDSKGIEGGNPIWLGVKNETARISAYIPEDFVQGGDIDFQESLEKCPAVTHAAGPAKNEYYKNPMPCYDSASLTNTESQFSDFLVYIEIGCYKTEGEAVNGNTTWIKPLRATTDCYIPGGWLDTTDIHGEAGIC